MLFRFFRFLIHIYFNEASVKNFMKKLSFLIQISKIYYKIWYITEYYHVKPCDAKLAAL